MSTDAPVVNPVVDPLAELAEWFALKARIAAECAPLVEQERAKRARLFAHFFPTPVEGTNTFVLPDGYRVKGTYPIERKVDQALVDTLRGLRLQDLPPELVDELHIDRAQHQPDELVVKALMLSLDGLLAYEPKLQTKPYRALTAEQTKLFDRCLTSKPGSISMEVVDPVAPKAAGNKPAGFGPQGQENL